MLQDGICQRPNVVWFRNLLPQIIDGYQKHLGCKVIGMPVSCYDEKMFGPGHRSTRARSILDIGVLGARMAWTLGSGNHSGSDSRSCRRPFKLDLSLEMNKRLSGLGVVFGALKLNYVFLLVVKSLN